MGLLEQSQRPAVPVPDSVLVPRVQLRLLLQQSQRLAASASAHPPPLQQPQLPHPLQPPRAASASAVPQQQPPPQPNRQPPEASVSGQPLQLPPNPQPRDFPSAVLQPLQHLQTPLDLASIIWPQRQKRNQTTHPKNRQ